MDFLAEKGSFPTAKTAIIIRRLLQIKYVDTLYGGEKKKKKKKKQNKAKLKATNKLKHQMNCFNSPQNFFYILPALLTLLHLNVRLSCVMVLYLFLGS